MGFPTGLRYLDFHHVDTKPVSGKGDLRLADGKYGLEELASTSELISKLDVMGEKEWFRKQMGMQKGAVHSRSNTLPVRLITSRQMHDILPPNRSRVAAQSLKEHFHI